MSPEAISKRFDILDELDELARVLARAKPAANSQALADEPEGALRASKNGDGESGC